MFAKRRCLRWSLFKQKSTRRSLLLLRTSHLCNKIARSQLVLSGPTFHSGSHDYQHICHDYQHVLWPLILWIIVARNTHPSATRLFRWLKHSTPQYFRLDKSIIAGIPLNHRPGFIFAQCYVIITGMHWVRNSVSIAQCRACPLTFIYVNNILIVSIHLVHNLGRLKLHVPSFPKAFFKTDYNINSLKRAATRVRWCSKSHCWSFWNEFGFPKWGC